MFRKDLPSVRVVKTKTLYYVQRLTEDGWGLVEGFVEKDTAIQAAKAIKRTIDEDKEIVVWSDK